MKRRVQVYLRSLGRSWASSKVSCLPGLDQLTAPHPKHPFSHLAKLRGTSPPFRNLSREGMYMPLAPYPRISQPSLLGIFMCYFYPPTSLYRMPLPITSFEQIGILIILLLLDVNPLKTCSICHS